MRICLVTTEYPPGPMGGVGTYSIILPPILRARGHSVTILTKHFEGSSLHEVVDGVDVHRLPQQHLYTGAEDKVDDELFDLEMRSLRSYVGVFAREAWRKLAELHAAEPFDIVLSQDVEAPTWIAQDRRMLFNEFADLPFVVFLHSPHWQIQYHNEDSQYDRHEYHRHLYEKHSISLADGLIAASHAMAGEVLQELGVDPDRLATLPLPLGPVPPPAPHAARHGAADDELRIVYSGRVELRKGVEYLLRAVVPLLREEPRLTLHLIGRDMPHPTLGGKVSETLTRRLLPADVRGRVVFRGWMPREELWAEYARASIGVIPSPWEPFSFVCQEMMACGTPVVATRTGGMADMIEDGVSGLLCEPSDPASLRDTLRRALAAGPATRQSWGEAAATRIRDFCSNERIVDGTLAFFDRVIARNREERATIGRVPVPGNLPLGELPALRAVLPPAPPPLRKVGVVIPCYNLGSFLPECLDSLAAQTFQRWEAYVVDDGSTEPATIQALEDAATRPGVQVLRFENGGLPVARNRGLRHAMERGCDAIVFLDADDRVEPSYFARAVDVLDRHPEASAVTAWTHTIGMMHTYWAPPHPQFPFLLVECMSTPPGMIRADVLRDVGGVHEEFKYAFEDWDLWVSLCATGRPVLMIPEPLIVYRMRVASMSRMFNGCTREHGRVRMARRHAGLYARYGAEMSLLQDCLRYADDRRYQTELQPIKEHLERALVDMAWHQKEWPYWKAKFEEEQARNASLQAELALVRESAGGLGAERAATLAALANTRRELETAREELTQALSAGGELRQAAELTRRQLDEATRRIDALEMESRLMTTQAALLRAELDNARRPFWARWLSGQRKTGG